MRLQHDFKENVCLNRPNIHIISSWSYNLRILRCYDSIRDFSSSGSDMCECGFLPLREEIKENRKPT